MMEGIPDWECPICCEVLSGKIFQCKEGHLFCESCREAFVQNKISECATCRTPLNEGTISRVRIFEEQLDRVLIPCSIRRCNAKVRRNGIKYHEKTCIYGINVEMELCKLLGYDSCEFKLIQRKSTDTDNACAATEHLIKDHGCLFFKDSLALHWTLNNFLEFTSEETNVGTWKCVFYESEKRRRNILIVCKVENGYLSWSCIDLSSSESKETEVTFMVPNEKFPKLVWTCEVLPASRNFLANTFLKTSVPYLRQLCSANGDLGMDVNIT